MTDAIGTAMGTAMGAPTNPSSPPSIRGVPSPGRRAAPVESSPRRRLFRAVFLMLSGGLAVWGVSQHPLYQQWRWSHESLPALEHQLPAHRHDWRFLYSVGRRLNGKGRFAAADPVLREAVGIRPDLASLRDEWARALLGSGLTTAAFGELREFVGIYPILPEAHLLMGKFYFTQHSMRRARAELARAIQLDPASAEGWAYLAAACDELTDLKQALPAARQAVALRPKNAGDHLMLAGILAETGAKAESRSEYARAADLAPRNATIHYEYANRLLQFGDPGDWELAEREARKAADLNRRDPGIQYVLGRALLRNGKSEAAIAPLTQSALLDTRDPAAPLALSRIYLARGKAADANHWQQIYLARQKDAADLQRLLDRAKLMPASPEPHRELAHALGLHGDVDGCVHNYAMALRCAVDAPPALIAAANALVDGGYPAAALPLARRAVSVSAANPAAHEALGNVYLGLGQLHLAGTEYNKTAGWWPRRTPILKEKLARFIAQQAAHPPAAEKAYQEARRLEESQFGPKRITPQVMSLARSAVALEPANPNYLWYLLRLQMVRRENDNAMRTAAQLLSIVPKDARAHAMLAFLLVDRVSTPAGFQTVQDHLKAAESEPSVAPTVHYTRGVLYLRRRQAEAAVSELRQSALLDPTADVTFYKLAAAEEMAGHPAEAASARAIFRQRQDVKRLEAQVLGAVAQHPDQPVFYRKAAAFYDKQGRQREAGAIRAEADRRFASRSPGKSGSSGKPRS